MDEILIIGLCSVICCGEDFDDMEDFGKDREEWLRGFLELPNGLPGNDTSLIQYRCAREIDGVKTVSVRHYISSFDTTAEQFLGIIRGHWSVENQLHWMLDVVFREDGARAKKDNSPLNLNVLRKIALAALKKISIKGSSVRRKMMKAARDPNFLTQVLFQK